MARLKLKIDIVSVINGLTSDRSKRLAYKRIMASPAAKRDYGNKCIDQIIDRTLSGKDKYGDSFKGYSDAYKNSLIFRIYQKEKNKVTLKLTGAMQSAIRVTGVDSRSVEIGITDSIEAEKASGHIDGANNLPVRDFWGLSVKETEEILKETLRLFSDETSAAIIEAGQSIGAPSVTATDGTDIDLTFEG